jgi:hypothetical protein
MARLSGSIEDPMMRCFVLLGRALMFNILAAELIFAGIFLGIAWATWPSPPWTALQYGGGIFMVLAPLICYPFSKTIFLAFDLLFRPVRPEDLDPTRTRAV